MLDQLIPPQTYYWAIVQANTCGTEPADDSWREGSTALPNVDVESDPVRHTHLDTVTTCSGRSIRFQCQGDDRRGVSVVLTHGRFIEIHIRDRSKRSGVIDPHTSLDPLDAESS